MWNSGRQESLAQNPRTIRARSVVGLLFQEQQQAHTPIPVSQPYSRRFSTGGREAILSRRKDYSQSTALPFPLSTPPTMAENTLPLIDFSGYISPKATPESKAKVIKEVSEACARYGFFQLKNHGVPLVLQKAHLQALSNFFSLPKEEKMKLSFLKDPCRRGYESSGDSLRDGDPLPDSKEVSRVARNKGKIRAVMLISGKEFLHWT